MLIFIFSLALLSSLLLLGLSLTSLLSNSFQFWPPPDKTTWQYNMFWVLFRIIFGAIIILSIFDFNGLDNLLRFYLGIALTLIGLGLGFYITFYLGWENAHGEEKGLKVSGWYAWSRNPIYTVSFIGFIGWGLAVNSIYVYVLFALLIGFYIFAPFLEEPWLEEHYGKAYLDYKKNVPRFFGWSRPK